MFYKLGRPVKISAHIDVPHKLHPMKVSDIMELFPQFVSLFNGESEKNTLSRYYKLNKETIVYEFRSIEHEEKIAKLLKVKIYEGSTDYDVTENRHLTEAEIRQFREDITDIRQCLNELNKIKLEK